jgi:prepilin-type N-terminal cleavage/methylation domain-containing protein
MKRRRGFSLLELVVASALLLIVVVGSVPAVLAATRCGGRAERLAGAHSAIVATLEQLRVLPFVVDDGAGSEHCVVGLLFPHACEARNTTSAFYSAAARDGHREATFCTVVDVAVGRIVTRATWVVATPSGWVPLQHSQVDGYAADQGGPPPSEALLVEVEVLATDGRPPARAATVFGPTAPGVGGGPSPAPSGAP